MLTKILVQLGLTAKEAEVYSLLLEYGPQTIQQLSKTSRLGRTHLYQITKQLITRGFIQSDKSKILRFSITNPISLSNFLNEQEKNLLKTKQLLNSLLPDLTKSYNLYKNNIEVSYLDTVSIPPQTKTKTLTYPKSGIVIYDDIVLLGHLKIQSKDIANRLRQELS